MVFVQDRSAGISTVRRWSAPQTTLPEILRQTGLLRVRSSWPNNRPQEGGDGVVSGIRRLSWGIYLSCILRPPLDPPAFWLVTACASVAICYAITSASGLKPSVKKPNDVFLAGRKVCGILTEARRDTVILGVGVSVNHVIADFPEELHQVATSIRIESGRKIDRIGLLRNILEELDEGYGSAQKRWREIRR